MTILMSFLGVLYLMVMAISLMIGGPKLLGKLNKFLFSLAKKFFKWSLKGIWGLIKQFFKWIGNILSGFYKTAPELFLSVIGVIIIIICLFLLFL